MGAPASNCTVNPDFLRPLFDGAGTANVAALSHDAHVALANKYWQECLDGRPSRIRELHALSWFGVTSAECPGCQPLPEPHLSLVPEEAA